MRQNFIGGASTTGGAGALTVAAVSGLALPSAAFEVGDTVEYCVDEFTDSTCSVLLKSESGFGTVAANVLTRSRPTVTWDGTTHNRSSPAALSFGTANVRVYLTAIAEGGPTAYPARANFGALFGPDQYLVPANMVNAGDYSTITLAANLLYMVPIRLEAGFTLTSLGVNVTAQASGKLISACIASIDPVTGQPGTVLLAANGLSTSATSVTAASVTGRALAPGWYWACFISDGTPAIMGSDSVGANPLGIAGLRHVRYATRSRTYAGFTVGTNAMTGTTGSVTGVGNLAAPVLLHK